MKCECMLIGNRKHLDKTSEIGNLQVGADEVNELTR